MIDQSLHDRDFYAWANEQAALLRAGWLSDADIAHIAEEIGTLGRNERRALINRLTILLLHLLKWQFQPNLRGASWRASIDNVRDDISDHLDDNPSLRSLLEASVTAAYRRASRQSAAETGLAEAGFPLACPWSSGQMMDTDFWPDAA
jgi:hypothetical protein